MKYPINALKRVLKKYHFWLAGCGASLFLLPGLSFAQAANDVTLRFANGQDSISGTLVKFEDNKYFINSTIGLAAIPATGVTCEGVGCPVVFESQDRDDTVVLTSARLNLTLRGTLLSYEGDTYFVDDFTYGQVEVSISDFECTGAGCPEQ